MKQKQKSFKILFKDNKSAKSIKTVTGSNALFFLCPYFTFLSKSWKVDCWFSMQLNVISGHCGIVVKWVQVMTCQESALTKQWPVPEPEQTVWPHCLMPGETGAM